MMRLYKKMRTSKYCLFILLSLLLNVKVTFAQRESVELENWLFTLADDAVFCIWNVDLKDCSEVNILHDWTHEKGIFRNGVHAANGGYFDGGIGWY